MFLLPFVCLGFIWIEIFCIHHVIENVVLDQAIYDFTRAKIHQSWFSQFWSTHMCRLRPQMPQMPYLGRNLFTPLFK